MQFNRSIPKTKGLDQTICLLKTGYPFIPNHMKELDTDIFQTRLIGKKAVCITGKDAAHIFYNPDYFIRHGANPKRVQKTLFGVNAIQGMDGKSHQKLKELFLSIMSEERIEKLNDIVRRNLRKVIPRWKRKSEICLFHESAALLCQSVCEWTEISITPKEARYRAGQFMNMVYAISSIGPAYWKGKIARKSTESWLESLIKDVRDGEMQPSKNTALYQITNYTDYDGKPMSDHAAAVELVNVIRPTVAISIYIVFSALALLDHQQYIDRLKTGDDTYYEMFAQEVRRFYPVGPFLGARTKKDVIFHDYLIKKHTLVFLDIYGINSSPDIWKYPKTFNPDNFLNWDHDDYEILSQGGGNPQITHRCPGERLTVMLMKTTIDFLVNEISYTVPDQNLAYSLKRIPTLPASGFIMNNIKTKKKSS